MSTNRFRFRFLLLGLAAALPALLTLLYIHNGERAEAADLEVGARVRAAAIAGARIGSALASPSRLLSTLAAVPGLNGGNARQCHEILANVLRGHKGYTNLVVVRPDGVLECAANPVDSIKFAASVGWLAEARKGHGQQIGEPQPSATSGESMVVFSRPVLDSLGRTLRFIAAGVELKPLSDVLAESEAAVGTAMTLVDDHGIIIAHAPPSAELIGRRFDDVLLQATGDSDRTHAEHFHVAGLENDSAAAPGYQVTYHLDPADIAAAANSVTRWFLLLIVGSMLIGGFAILIAAQRWFVRPATLLRRQADGIAAGNFTAASEVNAGLLGLSELGAAFDHMAVAVASRQAERDLAIEQLQQSVSERLAAEAALREADERMRFALEAANVGVWEANLQTGVSTWSPLCESMHGLAAGTFGRTFDAFVATIHPDDRGRAVGEFNQSFKEGTQTLLEYRTTDTDGNVRVVQSMGRHFFGADGKPLRSAGISMDVTERRRIEEQLRQSNKLEAIGQLAGGVAHDFNNMLTVISGNAEFALMGLTEHDPARGDLQEVQAAVGRASKLTRQLLALGRKQVITPELFDLSDMVEHVMPMLLRVIEENVRIDHVAADEPAYTVGDVSQLEQAVINLVVNARDAMPDGGSVVITTGKRQLAANEAARLNADLAPGAYVYLSVGDSGCGMSPQILARAFEPFFTTKAVGRGTGLGLPSVYGTVKQLGGHVLADSIEGEGTTITLLLPQAQAEQALSVRRSSLEASSDGVAETILLIEDDAAVRAVSERILLRAGYTVLLAEQADVAVARSLLYDGHIDLILSDVVMPGPPVMDAINEIISERPDTAVLFMSGYPHDDVRRRVQARDIDLLSKPFDAATLLSRIRGALKRSHLTNHELALVT